MKNLIAMFAGAFLPVFVLAGPVNVNTADAETISRELKGVGQSKAQAIVAYREAHGAFHFLGRLPVEERFPDVLGNRLPVTQCRAAPKMGQ